MKYGGAEIDWKYLGALLAAGDDKEQGGFFDSFIEEMDSWETTYKKYSQLSSIIAILKSKTLDTFQDMFEKDKEPL